MTKRCPLPATRLMIFAVTFLAFGLRVWRLAGAPPGWRDDELINSLVISQKLLDGDWAVYYSDASGHEALYHALNAGMLGVFGANFLGIRLLSAFLGTLAVPAIFSMGRRLGGSAVGLAASAGLAVSFWSLMYSRFGLRHILTPLLALLTLAFFWDVFFQKPKYATRNSLLAAFFMSLGFYTYFAGRGAPLILLAFGAYVWLVDRERFRQRWRRLALLSAAAIVMALPLFLSVSRQPESDARVAEVAVPLVEARHGNFEPLWRHVRVTLSMFHDEGDDEFLYNIPHRPVFGSIGAIFFWTGVTIALWQALAPVGRFLAYALRISRERPLPPSYHAFAAAFLLIWWLAGISPGFISVPPASLGHTILAQPAVFLLAAWPVCNWPFKTSSQLRFKPLSSYQLPITLILLTLLVVPAAVRDVPDYFVNWPARGMVRFLYRADIASLAQQLNVQPAINDFGVSSLLAGPWDRVALAIDLDESRAVSAQPRWFNPERVALVNPAMSFIGFPKPADQFASMFQPEPNPITAGAYVLNRAETAVTPDADQVCFTNGLCLLSADYDPALGRALLAWQAAEPLDLPPTPLISNPPPPGVYAGPRLSVFAQLLADDGQLLVGDDGLWIDPATLQPGDVFLQQHWLTFETGATAVAFGLYDPLTGERILTIDGRDSIVLKVKD